MQYRLITTKQGQIPIEDIQEGMEVYSCGEWKVAPKPVKGKCLKCSFANLPTTIFDKQFSNYKHEVLINHYPVLGKTEFLKDELAVRGHFKEDFNPNVRHMHLKGYDSISYWYPKFIRIFGETGGITFNKKGFDVLLKRKKFEELKADDLTERNLEYYLEGFLRNGFYWNNLKYEMVLPTSETDRIVLRLLDIEWTPTQSNTMRVNRNISLIKHAKDDYSKSKITEDQIIYILKHDVELPEYTPGNKMLTKEECIDWILPGINPDVNAMSPGNQLVFI